LVKVVCLDCGMEYMLNEDDKASDFVCECGGKLEERKTIADARKVQKNKPTTKTSPRISTKTKHSDITGLSFEGQKNNLFGRGYKVIDETDDEIVFSKDKPVLPIWAVIILALLFFPLVLLVFWKKPKLQTIKKPPEETKTTEVTTETAQPTGNLMVCPECQTKNPNNAEYCQECGSKL